MGDRFYAEFELISVQIHKNRIRLKPFVSCMLMGYTYSPMATRSFCLPSFFNCVLCSISSFTAFGTKENVCFVCSKRLVNSQSIRSNARTNVFLRLFWILFVFTFRTEQHFNHELKITQICLVLVPFPTYVMDTI